MVVSIDKLRKGLLAGAGLLVLVIAGFLAYAHHRAHRFLTELPRKLGADIRQETNSFTWSQTIEGRTVFTVHAAKAIQHKDGKYTMHDVEITVYGRGEGAGSRVDRIYGKEFELDQAAGVVRAMGEVHLDLQAPPKPGNSTSPESASSHNEDLKGTQLIHVKTSGLVYLQKLGVAATDQEIEFEYNGMTGHATGADYNTDSGVLLLHSAVKISGLDHGRPILLTADRADLNRESHKVVLTQARFVTVDAEKGGEAARQTVETRQATAFLRDDGSADHLIGEGGVAITTSNGAKITSQRGEMFLSRINKPESLRLFGNVHYDADTPERHATGDASEMKSSFNAQGNLSKAVFVGSVHLSEHIASTGKPRSGSERELVADTVDMTMASNGQGGAWLQHAIATGDACLRVANSDKEGDGIRTNTIRGSVLTAHFVREGDRSRLAEVHGDGSTLLEQKDSDGSMQTSSADTLNAVFGRPNPASSQVQPSFGGLDQVESALLQGHVTIRRMLKPAPKGSLEGDRATAQKATYEGRSQRILLVGAVELQNSEGTFWANRLEMDQRSGDATAEGSVKANYQQGKSGEPLHVLAQRADWKKATDTAIFYGSPSKPARLWQKESQIEAPVLQFEQLKQRLTARADRPGPAMAVRTVLVSAGDANPHKSVALAGAASAPRRVTVVRIGSREMVYSGETQTAQFEGGVKVESADGVMHGEQATAYFRREKALQNPASEAGSQFLNSGVEKVVIIGGIEIEQQGRRATGDRLVYTAPDGIFVLTGTEAQPPRVMDAIRGTVTGRELRFREQDASIVISNGDANGTIQRVRTETRVKKER